MEATPTLANRTDLAQQRPGGRGFVGRTELRCKRLHRYGASGETAQQPCDALEIGGRGRHDVNPAVGIVDPVHRDLVDAQTRCARPAPAARCRRTIRCRRCAAASVRDVGTDRLEAALRIGEPGGQGGFQDQVVAARDDLALGAAHHPGAAAQPGTDGEVGVAGDQRRHQRGERGEVGRQVDVHVREHRSVGRRPHRVQRAAAALLLEPHHPDIGELGGELFGDPGRVIDARVVGDGDAGGKRELVPQVAVQPVHRIRQRGLLVVHRDHHVEHRHPAARAAMAAFGRDSKRTRRPGLASGSRAISVMTSMVERPPVLRRGAKLCLSYEFFGVWVRS